MRLGHLKPPNSFFPVSFLPLAQKTPCLCLDPYRRSKTYFNDSLQIVSDIPYPNKKMPRRGNSPTSTSTTGMTKCGQSRARSTSWASWRLQSCFVSPFFVFLSLDCLWVFLFRGFACLVSFHFSFFDFPPPPVSRMCFVFVRFFLSFGRLFLRFVWFSLFRGFVGLVCFVLF